MRYSIDTQIFDALTQGQIPGFDLKGINYSDFDGVWKAMSAIDKIDIIVAHINTFDNLTPLLQSVTQETTAVTVMEEYYDAHFADAEYNTGSLAYSPTLQSLHLPQGDYSCAISISDKAAREDEHGTIMKMSSAIAVAYRNTLTKLALRTILTLPVDESRTTPCFWRNTSGFSNPEDQIAPHSNGLEDFPNTETHYFAENTYTTDMLFQLENAVRSKGYGDESLVIVASDSTWKKYKDAYASTDLEKLYFESVTSEFAPKPGQTTLVRMSDAEFPKDYFLCFDPNKQWLAKKISENENTRGLIRQFSTFEEARTNHRAEFKFYNTGFGVIMKGAGAVLYVGNSTYQNPQIRL